MHLKKTSRVKPLVKWPGGKSRLLKTILPRIRRHTLYCEPFAGGLAVLLAKPRSKVEVINDLNGELIGLYLCAQRHLPELLRLVEGLVGSRELFHLRRAQPGLTQLERAATFLLINHTSFGATMHSYAVQKTHRGAGWDRRRYASLLREIHERLDSVNIENLPYERCLKNYDSQGTFFFFDPPYLNADTGCYKGWSEAELTAFAERVYGLKGDWLITLDDSLVNRRLFERSHIEEIENVRCLDKQVGKERGVIKQLLISNACN